MSFIVIIPARFSSSRLPGKPLANINGKPMVIHVMERAQVSGANRVIVATDHISIVKVVEQAGGEVCLTSTSHQSGTERLQEVVDKYDFLDDQIIVNVQGDEPLIPPQIIHQASEDIITANSIMTTIAVPINNVNEATDQNIVKVLINKHHYAIYFSRTPIFGNYKKFTCSQDYFSYGLLRHIGIYAYRANFIRRYSKWSISPLEKLETLEQLRVLWYGEQIHVAIATNIKPSISIDTPKELAEVRSLCNKEYKTSL